MMETPKKVLLKRGAVAQPLRLILWGTHLPYTMATNLFQSISLSIWLDISWVSSRQQETLDHTVEIESNMEAVARLRNYPTSPRKMRLLADVIRGMKVNSAVDFLKHSANHPSVPLEKLLLSAVANWRVKNESDEIDDLFVKTIFVDGGRMLKRLRPAPQGRAHRIRKRSNHITIVVDSKNAQAAASTENPAAPAEATETEQETTEE